MDRKRLWKRLNSLRKKPINCSKCKYYDDCFDGDKCPQVMLDRAIKIVKEELGEGN